MSKKSSRNRNKSKGQKGKPDRSATAARDPAPGARNRPGFDLGGAVGDAKPDDKHPIKATVQPKDAVKQEAGNVTVDAKLEAKAKTNADKVTGRVQSAVAGVRNWLRGK